MEVVAGAVGYLVASDSGVDADCTGRAVAYTVAEVVGVVSRCGGTVASRERGEEVGCSFMSEGCI